MLIEMLWVLVNELEFGPEEAFFDEIGNTERWCS